MSEGEIVGLPGWLVISGQAYLGSVAAGVLAGSILVNPILRKPLQFVDI